MNYGRFFRLNQSLSKVVDGIAIYDYTDLPAYFGSSEENRMSPKYPVNLTITSNSVIFRLHYSVYRAEKDSELIYGYNIEEIKKYLFDSTKGAKMAHMEEVIFELPYRNDATDKLTATIKELYDTKFPQRLDWGDRLEGSSSGGRFLEQLIRKRFPAGGEIKGNLIERDMYESMRKALDTLPSYSTLWLMELLGKKSSSEEKYIDIYEKKEKSIEDNADRDINGFLRKLFLDFLFDLKHSDVFQSSRHYDQMHSGLMSDFYFSALMHKCEYYYYRKLTRQAIAEIEEDSMSEELKKKKKEAISSLYASELIHAEDMWIRDIINPQAEKDFEYRYPGKHHYLREIVEHYSFKPWPSWFAEPEEEMRRVCFTMREDTGEKHLCNAETLLTYLGIEYSTKDNNLRKLLDIRDDSREIISKWFLRQYDFQDVLHLHWFKYLNILFICLFSIPALYSLFSQEELVSVSSLYVWSCEGIMITVLAIFICLIDNYHSIFNLKSWNTNPWKVYKTKIVQEWIRRKQKSFLLKEDGRKSWILVARWKNIKIRIFNFITILFVIILIIYCRECGGDYIKRIPTKAIYGIFVTAVFALLILTKKYNIWKKLISSLHLFLPRLVASITLAWLTLSMGFDLYVSYFDYPLNVPYILGIVSIVMLFVMYEINRIMPHAPSFRKFIRSAELMIISYFISLSVGFVVINFLGEKYLERGGYINEYFTQYVDNKKDSTIKMYIDNKIVLPDDKLIKEVIKDSCCLSYGKAILQKIDSANQANNDVESFSRKLTENLVNVYHTEKKQKMLKATYPVAKEIKFWGTKFFLLKDFLIMFAFIAMFTGIFIQLIIFGDNKQMTEL